MQFKTHFNAIQKWPIYLVVALFSLALLFVAAQDANACYDCYDDSYYYGYGYDYYDDYYYDYDYCDYYCYDDYDYYYDYDYCYYDCYDDYDYYDDYCDYYCYEPTPPTPVDVCPNISGRQTSIPSGMIKDGSGNCVTPTPTLNVVCVANPSQAETGQNVLWRATASGGNGSYRYSWSGTNGLSGSSANVYNTYSTGGNKSATVTVTSGNQTDTATCNMFVEEQQQNNLSGFCEVNRTRVEEGEEVRYSASATGGSGSYSYEWNGSSPLGNRTGATQYVRYTSEGRKSASVTIRSGNQSITRDCSTVVVEQEDEDLDVVCEVSASRVYVGETVRWSADVDGGDGSYEYRWTGDVTGSRRTESQSYDTPGRKSATIRVRSNGETQTDTCSVEVIARGSGVTLYENPPTGNLAALSSVYLSQVPYTGPSDVLKYMGYILSLLAVSFVGTYYVLKRKAKANRLAFITNFKQDNLARKAN